MKSIVRSWKQVFVVVLVVSTALMPSTIAQGQVRSDPGVTIAKIGNPAWVPVDFHVFAAPIGTAPNYEEFADTQQVILPPPHYEPHTGLGIGPGTPERPPYNHDVADGVDEAEYPEDGPFLPRQFSHGLGVFLVYMVVPSADSHNLGSSPDFSRGPIIPNSLFPIQVTGTTNRNGSVYDANLANFKVPALNDPSVVPPFNVDGHSHFPIFIADNSDFGPPGTKLPGKYTYQLTMQDGLGNGWSITALFKVERDE